jgi:hypothetical protein
MWTINCAKQKSATPWVRNGSKGDIPARQSNVDSTPGSGHSASLASRWFWGYKNAHVARTAAPGGRAGPALVHCLQSGEGWASTSKRSSQSVGRCSVGIMLRGLPGDDDGCLPNAHRSNEFRSPVSRRQRSPFSQKCRRCPNAAESLVRSTGTDGNAKRARRGGNCMATYTPSFGCGPLNGPWSNIPISRTTIIRTSRIARARCCFRRRSGFIVSWSRPCRIAPERYFNWHRQINGRRARERVGAGA